MNKNEIVTQTFDINYKDKAEYLTFPAFTNSGLVRHLFSTRTGGYSEGIFASMNLGLNRGDAQENVIKNFNKIADILNCSIEEFVFSDQTHLDQVRVITKEDAGKGITRKKDFFDTDGMITNEPGIILATFYADCVPLYFLDPVNKAIGLTHSGWRGTVKQIGKKTVEAMKKNFGTDPANLIAGIGPSICENCYEVGAEVALEFKKIFPNDYHEVVKTNESGNFQLNLWEANRKILLLSGILERNISVTDLCTCCHSDYMFSHRATNGKRGNLGAFLGLL